MEGLVAFVQAELQALAQRERAARMQAYMKTDMPFYGVAAPARRRIGRRLRERLRLETPADYQQAVVALWTLPHREEKYLAIGVAVDHPRFIAFDQLPLYRRLIVEGAWWDLVDEVAAHLVGRVLLIDRVRTRPLLDRWVDDPDLWLRRSALISQLTHREETDADQLFGHCLRRAHETEFFIRKTIGWALRQYAHTDPEAVRAFLAEHGEKLSGLSRREASKHL